MKKIDIFICMKKIDIPESAKYLFGYTEDDEAQEIELKSEELEDFLIEKEPGWFALENEDQLIRTVNFNDNFLEVEEIK